MKRELTNWKRDLHSEMRRLPQNTKDRIRKSERSLIKVLDEKREIFQKLRVEIF